MPLDWNPTLFSAFAGTAKLDASFMVKTLNNNGSDNTYADCTRFYAWVEMLRLDVGPNTGIRAEYAPYVKILLEDFFPKPYQNNWRSATRIKTELEMGIVPVFSTVKFGDGTPEKREFKILDGATALGYIFSVAIPTSNNPTWENYYLPLGLLYSRCLYLAFVVDRGDDNHITGTLGDVPAMSCVMYARVSEPIRYFYGSSPARVCSASFSTQAESFNALRTSDKYKHDSILQDQLTAWSGTQLPLVSPKDEDALVDNLWTSLQELRLMNEIDPETQTKNPVLLTIQQEAILLVAKDPNLIVNYITIPLVKIKGHRKIWPSIRPFLVQLVNERAAGNYDLDAFTSLFVAFLQPRVYKRGDAGYNAEQIPKLPTDALKTALAPLSTSLKNDLQLKLDEVWARFKQPGIKPGTPFGRCAETYCVASLLPLYYANANMDKLRGISLEVSQIGSSAAFATGFTSTTLSQASGLSVLRLPCKNCQVLLPLFGVMSDEPDYNHDIFAVPDQGTKTPRR
ncbi:hypothetical protein GQ44DRAFT_759903 [Phaeosphaeriaceae sp. PMI808]|nr:hypothetical protein GQ44DRAFT_759903 [Phaeosphaeriaceae sp. PMI808]